MPVSVVRGVAQPRSAADAVKHAGTHADNRACGGRSLLYGQKPVDLDRQESLLDLAKQLHQARPVVYGKNFVGGDCINQRSDLGQPNGTSLVARAYSSNGIHCRIGVMRSGRRRVPGGPASVRESPYWSAVSAS